MKGRDVARGGWVEVEVAGGVVHARRWPCRFDLGVSVIFPRVRHPLRLARAVRQDLWRMLRDQRGLSPAVRIAPSEEGLRLTAGGQIDGAFPRMATEARVAAMLADPALRRRWIGWAAALVLAVLPGMGGAQEVIPGAPSGLAMELHEFLLEPQADGALWARFRLVAPELGRGVEFSRVEGDFPWFCETQALPRLRDAGAEAALAVISISSRLIPFGETAPDVVQFFEAFRLDGDRCIWEVF